MSTIINLGHARASWTLLAWQGREQPCFVHSSSKTLLFLSPCDGRKPPLNVVFWCCCTRGRCPLFVSQWRRVVFITDLLEAIHCVTIPRGHSCLAWVVPGGIEQCPALPAEPHCLDAVSTEHGNVFYGVFGFIRPILWIFSTSLSESVNWYRSFLLQSQKLAYRITL